MLYDDEDASNRAIEAGTFAEDFKDKLADGYKQYCRRIKAHVRADRDNWAAAVEAAGKSS